MQRTDDALNKRLALQKQNWTQQPNFTLSDFRYLNSILKRWLAERKQRFGVQSAGAESPVKELRLSWVKKSERIQPH